LWLLTGPLADLRTAMVIAREQRGDVSAAQMIDLTIDAFYDEEAIAARREGDVEEVYEWDERYLENVFTARFGNIKFNDINLVMAMKVREYDPDVLAYLIDHLLGALPTPLLKAFNLDVDKEMIYSLSMGDYLYIAAGGSGFVSGFRSGHFAGMGIAAFGWWYLFILGVGMVFVFALFDKFNKPKLQTSSNEPSDGKMHFSFCGLLALTAIFQYFIVMQSVTEIIIFIFRGWIQMAFLYILVFHITRILTGFIRSSKAE
jgi:hypothetical protein